MVVERFVAAGILAYFLGAIPFAYLISKWLAGIDITKCGSGNIGGTNVLRTLGAKAGFLVIVLDITKSVAAVMLAKLIIGDGVLYVAGFPVQWQAGQFIAGLMAMVGHNWSVYMKFRGGKGVAAYYGSWVAMFPLAAAFGGLITVLTALRTRYMSLGSILGALGVVCFSIVLALAYEFPVAYLVYSLVATALLIYQHRKNISRLQAGTELRLDVKGGGLSL